MLLPRRLIAFVCSLLAVVGISAAAPALASAPSTDPSSATSNGADSTQPVVTDQPAAGTAAQAEQIAAEFGHRVEATALDDASSTTYVNPDGTQTLEASATTIRVKRDGGWVPVDSTLHSQADGSIVPAAVPANVVLGGAGSTTAVTLNVSGGSLSYGWPTPLPSPILSGGVATYPEVLPGVDLVVTVSVSGAETSLVYHNAQAIAEAPSVALPLTVSGLTGDVSPAGAVSFVDADGQAAARIDAPLAWDARAGGTVGTPGDRAASRVETEFTASTMPRSDANARSIPSAGFESTTDTAALIASADESAPLPTGDLTQTVSVPESLAADPATVFPVVVDPTLTCTNDDGTDCSEPVHGYIENDGDDEVNSTYDSSRVHVGTFDGGTTKTRGLFSFTQGASHNADLISSAVLTLNNVYSWSCTARSLTVYRASQFTASVSWADPPGIDSDNPVTHSYAHGYDSSCASDTEDYNVTSFVNIQSGQSALSRYYFELRAGSETDSTYWKKFSQNAKLVVSYDFAPNTPTSVRFTSTTHGAPTCTTGTGRPKIDPNYAMAWQATVSDHDGGSVAADFQWWDLAASATKYASAVTVSSGTNAVLNIGAWNSHFLDGHSYGFHVAASDGVLSSAWSATTCEFTVADPLPNAPASVGFASSTHGTPGCATGTARPTIDPNYAMTWQAKVSDPDARKVNAQFQWWDLASPTTTHPVNGTSVASGALSLASFAALTSSFVDGHSYGFQVRTYNSSKYSAWTAAPTCEFTVKDPPPNDPTGLKFASPIAACGASIPANYPFTLQASISDPDGRSVQAIFTLNGGTQSWSYTTALAAGSVVTATVPANLVADGSSFNWSVRTYNKHKYSTSTPICAGTADYSRPAAPQITSTGTFGTAGSAAGHVGDADAITITADNAVKYVVILTAGLSGPTDLPAPDSCETSPDLADGQAHTLCAASGTSWNTISVTAPDSAFTVTAQAYNDANTASPLGSTSFQLLSADVDHEWLTDQHASEPDPTIVSDQAGGPGLQLSESGTSWTSAQYPGEADDPDAPLGGPTTWNDALHLEGTGYATTGSGTGPLAVDATDSFTTAIWVRPESASDDQHRDVALSVDGTNGPGLAIGQYDGQWFFCLPTASSTSPFDGDCATVAQPDQADYVGQWTLLVAEWDSAAQQIHLYAEGLDNGGDTGVPHTSVVSAFGPLEVGAINTGTLTASWTGDVMNPATFGDLLDADAVSNLTCGLDDDPSRSCAS